MSGRYPTIICITVVLHLIWSIGLLLDPSSVNATGIHTVLIVARTTNIAAIFFAAVAVSAIVGLLVPWSLWRFLLILPQQMALWFSMIGAANAMYLGQFADGIQRSHWFLIVDQVPVVLIALGHTVAIVLVARRGDG